MLNLGSVVSFSARDNGNPLVAIFTTYVDNNGKKKMDPTTESLRIKASELDLPVEFIHVDDFSLVSGDTMELTYKGKSHQSSPFMAVLPRIGARWLTEPMLRVLSHLQDMGAKVLNPPEAIRLAEDKFATHQLFAKHGIPQPKSLIVQGKVTQEMLSGFGDKLIIKPNSDTSGGRGVRVVSKSDLIGMELSGEELVQEYVANDNDVTYRYVFANGQCLSATEKRGGFGDANEDICESDQVNATYKSIDPNSKMVQLGIKALNILGLNVGSVDFVGNENSIRVLEVNPSFGLEKSEKETVCQALLKYLISFTTQEATTLAA